MSSDWNIKPFLWTLNILGLFNYHNTNKNKPTIRSNRNNEIRALLTFSISQLTSWIIFLYWIKYPEQFQIEEYNRVGNIYLSSNFGLCCLLTSVIYINFYINHKSYKNAIELIIKYQEYYKQSPCNGNNLQRLYILYVFLVITNAIDVYIVVYKSKMKIFGKICYLIFFNLSFILCGIIIMIYVCITKILNSCLIYINMELLKMTISTKFDRQTKKVYNLIMQRKSILDICHHEISYRYGFLLLTIVSFILYSTPSGPYNLITYQFEFKFENLQSELFALFVTLYLNVPWLVIFILLMTSSDVVENEVNIK